MDGMNKQKHQRLETHTYTHYESSTAIQQMVTGGWHCCILHAHVRRTHFYGNVYWFFGRVVNCVTQANIWKIRIVLNRRRFSTSIFTVSPASSSSSLLVVVNFEIVGVRIRFWTRMGRRWVRIKIVFRFSVLLLGENFNVYALRDWNLHLFFQHFLSIRQSALNNKIKTDIVIHQIRFVCARCCGWPPFVVFIFSPVLFHPAIPLYVDIDIRISFTLSLCLSLLPSLLSPIIIICRSFCAVPPQSKQQLRAHGTPLT